MTTQEKYGLVSRSFARLHETGEIDPLLDVLLDMALKALAASNMPRDGCWHGLMEGHARLRYPHAIGRLHDPDREATLEEGRCNPISTSPPQHLRGLRRQQL